MATGSERLVRHAPATLRNREPILAVLQRVLPAAGLLLEVASGSGEHAAFITPRLPQGWKWQPSETSPDALEDIDARASAADCSRIRRAIVLNACDIEWPVQSAEAVFCCNMIHISPWEAAEGLFAGSSRILANATPLILYGPFKRNGTHTASSNETFDDGLRLRDPRWGVRCFETEVVPLAEKSGFVLDEVVAMPADNLTVIFRRISFKRPAKLAVGAVW
jgi:SAM-dependent methyltransferase